MRLWRLGALCTVGGVVNKVRHYGNDLEVQNAEALQRSLAKEKWSRPSTRQHQQNVTTYVYQHTVRKSVPTTVWGQKESLWIFQVCFCICLGLVPRPMASLTGRKANSQGDTKDLDSQNDPEKKKKNNSGDTVLPDFKLWYKMTIIKTFHQHYSRQKDKWDRIEPRSHPPHKCLWKHAECVHRRRTGFLRSSVCKTGEPHIEGK